MNTQYDLTDALPDDLNDDVVWVEDKALGKWVCCDKTTGKSKWSVSWRPGCIGGQKAGTGPASDPEWFGYGPYGHGSYGGSVKQEPKKAVGVISLMAGNGDQLYRFRVTDEEWWDAASEEYGPIDGVMHIPLSNVKLGYKSPAFNACVYEATRSYVEARWGRRLDPSDLEWLKRHPLATDDGIPMPFAPTAIQQLLEPYGLRVSRVRLRRGKLSMSKELSQWMDALGVNPFAMADRQTTNAEAIEKLDMTLEQANALWRFEYHDEPFYPSIIGEKSVANSQGVQTGYGGGHARYLAPRGYSSQWDISIMLAPEDHVTYQADLTLPAYVEREGSRSLNLYDINDRAGRVVCVLRKNKYVRNRPDLEKKEGSPDVLGAPAPTHLTQVARRAAASGGGGVRRSNGTVKSPSATSFQCRLCATVKDMDAAKAGMDDVCTTCYFDAWSPYTCPNCKTTYGYVAPKPLWRDPNTGEAVFECGIGKCKERFVAREEEASEHPMLAVLAGLVLQT